MLNHPDDLLKLETKALNTLFAGPGNWSINNDLWHMPKLLKSQLHIPSVNIISVASKWMVFMMENINVDKRANA